MGLAFSQAVYYCIKEPSFSHVPTENSTSNNHNRPPLHPHTPKEIKRRNNWYIPAGKNPEGFVEIPLTPRESLEKTRPKKTTGALIEYAVDPLNPCDICEGIDAPTKIVDCWIVCRECIEA